MSARERLSRWIIDDAVNLAAMRVSVGAVILSVGDVHALAVSATRIPLAVRTPPLGWSWMLRAAPIAPGLAEHLRAVITVCALTGALGFFSRLSFATLSLAGVFLWAHAMTLGSAVHFHHLLWFSLLLAASPCGDALSLDRRLFKRGAAPPCAAYGVPLRAAWLLVGAVYFFPGAWKLGTSGLAWIFSDNLLLHMRAKWFQFEGFSPLFRVDRHPWLCRAGALGVVLFELSFGALVLRRRTRAAAVLAALLFHQATDWLMGLRYPALWGCYALFIDWTPLVRRLGMHAERVAAQRDPRAVTTVSAALLAGAMSFGATGESDAWPFACYPKFDRLAPASLPVMEVYALTPGGARRVPDRAMFPAGRTQRYWSLSWSLMGAHRSERATEARFEAFWRSVATRPAVREASAGARAVRFERVAMSTDPDRPVALRRAVLAEVSLDTTHR